MPSHRPTHHRHLMLALAVAALFASCPGAAAASAPQAPSGTTASSLAYLGGCRTVNVHQEELSGQSWVGIVTAAVVATSAGVPLPVVVVSCEFLINGVSQGTVLMAAGNPVAANAGRFQYDAAPDDNAVLCTYVTINTVAYPPDCSVQVVLSLP